MLNLINYQFTGNKQILCTIKSHITHNKYLILLKTIHKNIKKVAVASRKNKMKFKLYKCKLKQLYLFKIFGGIVKFNELITR